MSVTYQIVLSTLVDSRSCDVCGGRCVGRHYQRPGYPAPHPGPCSDPAQLPTNHCTSCHAIGKDWARAGDSERPGGGDVSVLDGGSIFIVTAMTDAALAWIREHVQIGDFNPDFPRRVIVEHRFISDLLNGMSDEGLTVEAA